MFCFSRLSLCGLCRLHSINNWQLSHGLGYNNVLSCFRGSLRRNGLWSKTKRRPCLLSLLYLNLLNLLLRQNQHKQSLRRSLERMLLENDVQKRKLRRTLLYSLKACVYSLQCSTEFLFRFFMASSTQKHS